MEKITTAVDKRVNYELSFRAIILYGLFALAGVAGVIAGVFFGQVLGYDDFSVLVIFVACGLMVLMGGGLAGYVVYKIQKNTAENLVIETEFFDDYLTSVNTKNGEKISESKINYSQFLFYRETTGHVYLYPSKVTALPLNKRDGLVAFVESKGIKRKGARK